MPSYAYSRANGWEEVPDPFDSLFPEAGKGCDEALGAAGYAMFARYGDETGLSVTAWGFSRGDGAPGGYRYFAWADHGHSFMVPLLCQSFPDFLAMIADLTPSVSKMQIVPSPAGLEDAKGRAVVAIQVLGSEPDDMLALVSDGDGGFRCAVGTLRYPRS